MPLVRSSLCFCEWLDTRLAALVWALASDTTRKRDEEVALSTKRLAAFNVAHYTGGRQLLERGGIYRRAAPRATCQKRLHQQQCRRGQQLRQQRKQLRGETEYIKNIVSTLSKELSGIYG